MTDGLPVLDVPVRPLGQPAVYRQYQEQQVLSASPLQLLVTVYDQALVGCEARDGDRTRRALTELIGALNFDAGEIALDLFRLYEYCLLETRRQRFPAAAGILRTLRSAWADALSRPPR